MATTKAGEVCFARCISLVRNISTHAAVTRGGRNLYVASCFLRYAHSAVAWLPVVFLREGMKRDAYEGCCVGGWGKLSDPGTSFFAIIVDVNCL